MKNWASGYHGECSEGFRLTLKRHPTTDTAYTQFDIVENERTWNLKGFWDIWVIFNVNIAHLFYGWTLELFPGFIKNDAVMNTLIHKDTYLLEEHHCIIEFNFCRVYQVPWGLNQYALPWSVIKVSLVCPYQHLEFMSHPKADVAHILHTDSFEAYNSRGL